MYLYTYIYTDTHIYIHKYTILTVMFASRIMK